MTTPSSTAAPAPTWRRGVAFAIDSLIIAAPLEILGHVWFEAAADLGDAGRWIGVAADALYFGAFESAWGEGMSLGKAWLGLQVVDRNGAFLSPARAATRALFAEAPFLLNGVGIPGHYALPGWIVWLLVAGLAVAQPYLAIFNRPSRRCLHDLAFGTTVIRRYSGVPAPSRLAPIHAVVVAAIFAFFIVKPLGLWRLVPASPETADSVGGELSRRVEALPEIKTADTGFQDEWNSKTGRSQRFHVTAELRRWPADPATVANAAAQAIFHGDAPLVVPWPVTLTLHRGFTFGVADFEYEETYRLDGQGSTEQTGD